MNNTNRYLLLLAFLVMPCTIIAQTKTTFTGDPGKFSSELTAFMGPNLNDQQKLVLGTFTMRWDSAAFSNITMGLIQDISSQFAGRAMRPVPHFNNYLTTLNFFAESGKDEKLLNDWLRSLSELAFNPRFTSANIDRYITSFRLLISENILSESPSIRWKTTGGELKYVNDTIFAVEIKNSTITCYSQRDSTLIYNATGYYYPDLQQFRGSSGRVTWEKAGYAPDDVYAEIKDYIISTTRNNFSIDSALLTHKNYFPEPVYGSLTDQAINFSSKDRANYPRFETYIKEFRLNDIYEGVNYQGGLAFEGATVKGTGSVYTPASIELLRNDTLYIRAASGEFLFSRTGFASAETTMTLYLDKDSVYNSNLGFSYNSESRQVNFFRGNNPVSRSPYFNSFHNIDMYFEYMSWNMNESKIIMSRARGAALGQAQFESASYFDRDYYFQLAGIDQQHPLVRLKRFAEWYYSNTFPVEAFAKWLNKPDETVIAMCIDLANRGFVHYDRRYNEVTLKKKVDDFINSFTRKQDYDALNILSETRAPVDNAILDLKNFRLTINGVPRVILSNTQRVAIYPYSNKLVLGRNRDIEFDGVVQAGLFTVFGHEFSFSYDTFKIRLQKIDSIKIAMETDQLDMYGNPLIKEVDNLIQLGTAELYIDMPDNKSGLRKLEQYPIINAVTYSYIFFDKIPGLEGVYPQEDFYFRIDPFTYENIDHYTMEDMNLAGEFIGGKVFEPIRQNLSIQPDNSLGFNMIIPDEGLEIYSAKGKLYENLSMSNEGLIGRGSLKHLTSQTKAEEYRFFPDSMITDASSFVINRDPAGLFPELASSDVNILWQPWEDRWKATNTEGKNFEMFANGTRLNGSVTLRPSGLEGSGIVGTSDSRITSEDFRFNAVAIKADTAEYNLRSTSTDGFAFIAENVNAEINFAEKRSRFTLNTDNSVVKFPEIQYICTMTDFEYNMDTHILNMVQKGMSDKALLNREELLALGFDNLDKPTFKATNVIGDTISFSSWKGRYNLDNEYIEAENINYIHIADALIQPDSGKITIDRRAKIRQLSNATVAVNNKHLLHTAKIDIESTKRYAGSAVYDYKDENNEIQKITFSQVTVDTLRTSAKGYIAGTQEFMLSPAFSFTGDVSLYSEKDHLSFSGAAGTVHDCSAMLSYPVKFRSYINPLNVLIPYNEKPRDINDNLIFSGSYLNIDSVHIYPAFLSAQKSWNDVALVNANGFLWYEKAKGRYLITSLNKILDQTISGNMIAFDKNYCTMSGEGTLNFGANFDLVKTASAGNYVHNIDSGTVRIKAVMGFDFHFSPEGLKIMSDEIRMIPTLKAVDLNSELYSKGLSDMLGQQAAAQIKDELNLFGTIRELPKTFNYELLLSDVTLVWNELSSSFRSTGKIGIGFIGPQPVNVYVDGIVEIQRRRSGDMFDIYLKADESTWYYFSYIRGNMMTQSGNNSYNTLIANTKQNDRKHPGSSVRTPYTYMISVEDRLGRFLRRIESENEPPPGQEVPDGLSR